MTRRLTTAVVAAGVGIALLAGCGSGPAGLAAPGEVTVAGSAEATGAEMAARAGKLVDEPGAPEPDAANGEGSATLPHTSEPRTPAPDPVVEEFRPADRPGAKPDKRKPGKPESMAGEFAYPDGLRLKITSIKQGRISGHGPGVIVGEPKTAFTLRVMNRTGEPFEIESAVVTLLYGDPQRQALPVYDEAAIDLLGVVPAGRQVVATYVFSVPRRELDDVSLLVDLDADHKVAAFRGSAR